MASCGRATTLLGVLAVLAASSAEQWQARVGPRPPAAHALNITVFHVNPSSYGAIPFNMDVGDALGDLYFIMRSVVLPLECADDPTGEDCTNEEVTSTTLVTSKLLIEVDSRWGAYGHCNICTNSTKWFKCTLGEYYCYGGHNVHKVGFEYPNTTHSTKCDASMKPYQCWRNRVVTKFGGQWWSFFNQSYCPPDGPVHKLKPCAWRVVSLERVVNTTCVQDRVYSAIEAHTPKCFKGCPAPVDGRRRNTTDACWIRCVYESVLGPEASTPNASITGMPVGKIVDAWDGSFAADSSGCPPVPAA